MIKSIPSENLAEILKRTTNLDIIQYPGLSATIGMRGFSPSAHSRSYTLLLINGKPAGTTNLATISTDNIEQIDRGYERIDDRLRSLGASIERISC